MKKVNEVQLAQLADTGNPAAVLELVQSIFLLNYSPEYFSPIPSCYALVVDLFQGRFPGYKACNTEYHNLNHTLDALIAVIRLVDGYNIANKPLAANMTVNLLIASLFHDTGYIQEAWDHEGTGAKFTVSHIKRSIDFLCANHRTFSISETEIPAISRIIQCTGLSIDMKTIPFESSEEKLSGAILGTADLLGQMSDRIYLEKLLFLYHEFKEAGIEGFSTEFDILKKTIDFYKVSQNRFKHAYMRVYMFAAFHFEKRLNIARNLYTDAIDRHIVYLKKIIKDDSSNFRHKLKRADWVHTLPHGDRAHSRSR